MIRPPIERSVTSWGLLGVGTYIRSSNTEVTGIYSVVNHGPVYQGIALYPTRWVYVFQSETRNY